jgi:hypothetical protein
MVFFRFFPARKAGTVMGSPVGRARLFFSG